MFALADPAVIDKLKLKTVNLRCSSPKFSALHFAGRGLGGEQVAAVAFER
jgi:hypothetical protein